MTGILRAEEGTSFGTNGLGLNVDPLVDADAHLFLSIFSYSDGTEAIVSPPSGSDINWTDDGARKLFKEYEATTRYSYVWDGRMGTQKALTTAPSVCRYIHSDITKVVTSVTLERRGAVYTTARWTGTRG